MECFASRRLLIAALAECYDCGRACSRYYDCKALLYVLLVADSMKRERENK